MAAISMSFVIGSPIAGWILGHNWFAVQGWRWLFIVEGLPAIVLGIVAFFYLTDPKRSDVASFRSTAMDWTRAAAREACH
jgi:MFS transporter, ACS family, tartrate transporter